MSKLPTSFPDEVPEALSLFRLTLFEDGAEQELWVTSVKTWNEVLNIVDATDLWPGMELDVEWTDAGGTWHMMPFLPEVPEVPEEEVP